MKLLTITAVDYQELKEKLDTLHNIIEQSGKSKNQDLWLDSRSVCKLLKISNRTLQKLRDEARIPYSRLSGGIIRYRSSDIDAYMNLNYVSVSNDGLR